MIAVEQVASGIRRIRKKGVLNRVGGTRGHWEVSNHVQ